VSDLFLGLDLGTSGVKLVAFDPSGAEMARASRSYATRHPSAGMAELDPDLVWDSALACFAELAPVFRAHRAASLAVSAQGEAVIPVARDGAVLAPSPISADMRGSAHIARLAERLGAERIERITGQPVSPLPSLAKILWWEAEQPALAARVWKYLCYGDFALLRLGMDPVIDESMAARTLAYDITERRWSRDILDAAGIASDRLPEVAAGGTIAGILPEPVASALGLVAGVTVVIGGHDQPMGALGAGVIRPGQVMYSIGTTEALVSVLPSANPALPRANIACYPHVLPGRYVALAGSQTGGRAIQWLAAMLQAAPGEASVLDRLETVAASFRDGPLFLAHLAGSGSVTNDPESVGVFHGLRFDTTRDQLIGAVLEGVTFEQAIAVEALAAAGMPVEELRAVGGGTRSRAWLAMKADILGHPVTRVGVGDAPCLGAAILGAVATGRHAGIEEAVSKMVRTGDRHLPRAEKRGWYATRLDAYRQLYLAARSVRESLAPIPFNPPCCDPDS
jgi:xylulokinase